MPASSNLKVRDLPIGRMSHRSRHRGVQRCTASIDPRRCIRSRPTPSRWRRPEHEDHESRGLYRLHGAARSADRGGCSSAAGWDLGLAAAAGHLACRWSRRVLGAFTSSTGRSRPWCTGGSGPTSRWPRRASRRWCWGSRSSRPRWSSSPWSARCSRRSRSPGPSGPWAGWSTRRRARPGSGATGTRSRFPPATSPSATWSSSGRASGFRWTGRSSRAGRRSISRR